MHLALYALSSIVAVWFVATSLVAIRRGLMGRDLELALAAVGEEDSRPARSRAAAQSIATAA